MLNDIILWIKIALVIVILVFIGKAVYKKMHEDVARNNKKFNDEINRYKNNKK